MQKNFYDISAQITNQLPTLKITDDIIVTVDNRHKNVLCIQGLALESEGKITENELMDKSIAMLIGEKHAKAIEELNLPLPEYKLVYQTLLKVALGNFKDTPSK